MTHVGNTTATGLCGTLRHATVDDWLRLNHRLIVHDGWCDVVVLRWKTSSIVATTKRSRCGFVVRRWRCNDVDARIVRIDKRRRNIVQLVCRAVRRRASSDRPSRRRARFASTIIVTAQSTTTVSHEEHNCRNDQNQTAANASGDRNPTPWNIVTRPYIDGSE